MASWQMRGTHGKLKVATSWKFSLYVVTPYVGTVIPALLGPIRVVTNDTHLEEA